MREGAGRTRFFVFPLAAVLAGACAVSPPPTPTAPAASTPANERTTNPCITFTPASFAAGWSLTEDRRCTTTADCTEVLVKFENLSCKSGLMGTFASTLASRAAEATVRGRLAALDPCQLGDKMQVRSMCKAPPLTCEGGSCAYADAPPHIGF